LDKEDDPRSQKIPSAHGDGLLYVSQIITGHSDFKEKLKQFKLVESPDCSYLNGSESVHVLLCCSMIEVFQSELIKIIESEDES